MVIKIRWVAPFVRGGYGLSSTRGLSRQWNILCFDTLTVWYAWYVNYPLEESTPNKKRLQHILPKNSFRTYKECLQISKKRLLNSKVEKDLTDLLQKENIQMANKHSLRCSTVLVIKETQIKTITLCHNMKWRRGKHLVLLRMSGTQMLLVAALN